MDMDWHPVIRGNYIWLQCANPTRRSLEEGVVSSQIHPGYSQVIQQALQKFSEFEQDH